MHHQALAMQCKNQSLFLQAVAFAQQAFNAVAVHSPLKVFFGNRHPRLQHNSIISRCSSRLQPVIHPEGISTKGLPLFEKGFNIGALFQPFFFMVGILADGFCLSK